MTRYNPTLVDTLIATLKADCEKRGLNSYPYTVGYLGSMLQSLADKSPKVRKEIETTLRWIKERK